MLFRLVAASALSAFCLYASAQEHNHPAAQASELVLSEVWSRAMPPSAPTGAVYFVLENRSDQERKLIGAHTSRAQTTELHTHVRDGDIMKMQQIDSVVVPAAERIEFKPGANHVMLIGLKQPLVAGERFALTLQFENSEEITTEVSIEAQAPNADAHSHH